MRNINNPAELERIAGKIRLKALEMTVAKKKGHLGGTFSCVDILVALYYGGVLGIDPSRPQWPDRDRFILSKGHACLGLYPILVDLGFMSQERFDTYGDNGGLGGQLDTGIPGVEWNTGSLGHALGVCAGMALAAKMDRKNYYAYALLGDAECAEGSIWEAITFAGEKKLNNLVALIDRNRLSVTEVLDDDSFFRSFPDAVRSLGWDCFDVNGHSIPALLETFQKAKTSEKPVLIICQTIKGKGVSFMENTIKWHHSVPTAAELEKARSELSA